jgi:hypothetical protein
MTPTDTDTGAGQCPHCGAQLITGTADLGETPDETTDVDQPRAELRPGQMVQSLTCPTPGCPGPDTGAQV